MCAQVEILLDLRQQLSSTMALERIKHNTELLAHVEMKFCLARTAKDLPGSCEEKCFFKSFFEFYFLQQVLI